ncbi:MAG: zinc-ribbon and DUF3426 domain-containing protein [Betaproteobacteria bacterium]|jgi:predicted Zn finger-like uncharacterized protein
MTLTTRCPACNTVFKVEQDQLRLADGWVRCGRCAETFPAHDALAQLQAAKGASGPLTADAAALADDFAPAAPPPRLGATDPIRPGSSETDTLGLADTLRESATASAAAAQRYLWDPTPQRTPPPQPWVTAAWGAAGAISLVSLLVQTALAWHDELAHAVPALRPGLEVACVMAECRIEPARRIEALTIESSQLTQLGGAVYQFSLTIRNRATVDLTPPALDLVLTGQDGQVITRKVLRWVDFGQRTRSIAAQKDMSLQTHLNTGNTAVTGFTIELFYP